MDRAVLKGFGVDMRRFALRVHCSVCGRGLRAVQWMLGSWLGGCLPVLFSRYYRRVDVVLVSDAEIARWAGYFLGDAHAHPTDILTFGDWEVGEGQLLIDVAQVVRQAPGYSMRVSSEFLFVVAHGFLHLLGFRDSTRDLRETMWRIQSLWVERFPSRALPYLERSLVRHVHGNRRS